MILKKTSALVALAALFIAPAFAFANGGEDKGNKEMHRPMIDKTTVSVGIANNGAVLVRGAKVTDIAGDVIKTEATVNGVMLSWSIDTDTNTSLVEAGGDTIVLADIKDGDYVSFSGMLTGATTVDADTIRDWSQTSTSTDSSDDQNDDHDDNGVKVGFWGHMKKWPMFSFFGHAKVEDK